MNVETIVSVDLFGIGKTSGHPVSWLMIVSMCLFPEGEVAHSITRSMVILSKGLSRISVICSGYDWTLDFSLQHSVQLAIYFQMSLFILFQYYCHFMRQYVQVIPWSPSLSCASTNIVYFQAFGMMSAINFWFTSMTCLYSSPLMCMKRSASCFGVLLLDSHFEMCFQDGSVFCIWRRASLSFMRGCGVTSWVLFVVVKSCVTVSLLGWLLEGSALVAVWCDVLLLVFNAGLSE